MFWPLMQEYLRLSDVYKMYGNASLPSCSSSPAALHCLSLSVAPALPCEVDIRLLFAVLFSDFLPQTASEHLVLLSSLFCVRPFSFRTCAGCLSVCVKDYITVSQLSQIFGMQRIDPSSSSSLPSFQLATSETTFSCHSTPSTFPSAQVCPNCSLVCLIFLEMATLLREHFSFLISARCFCL